jgi:predicted NUDIX family NTP pyrophosphohydrolase
MPKPAQRSAGLLLCRRSDQGWEFLLAHPGGPFFAKKDDGFWTVPKGLIDPDEDALRGARREFTEETGFATPERGYHALGEIAQKGGKRVQAFAFVGEADLSTFVSNTFELEWPPRSGRTAHFPEVDRVGFFTLEAAQRKLMEAQHVLLQRALEWLATL